MTENEDALAEADMREIAPGLSSYLALPAGEGPFPAVLVFIEAFGVNGHIQDVCRRLAGAGIAALAPDIYHGDVFSYENMDGAISRLRTMDDDQVMQEAAQALDHLAGLDVVDAGALGMMGFCMGGRFAFLAHQRFGERSRAAACFYGAGIAPAKDPFGRPALLDHIKDMHGPVALYYGAQDTSIHADEHGRIAEAFTAAHRDFLMRVFHNTGHGFFCEQRKSYKQSAADEAWELTLGLFRRHLHDRP